MEIREISSADIDDFIRLSAQLGYDADSEYIAKRISEKDSNEIVFVAAYPSKIIGWIDCKISRSFISRPYGEIVGFIVDQDERSKGVGKLLLQRVELWMSDKNCGRILVHSNVKRERAHSFYISNEYEYVKKSMLFRKEL